MVEEMWKPIDGFDGYEISDQGRVRSWWVGDEPRLLALGHHTDGYRQVSLYRDGKRYSRLVHRLVALTFLPPPTPEQTHVCHGDGNPSNNRVGNLRWDTPAGNHADKKRHGTSNRGERNGSAKLNANDVAAIRAAYRGRGGPTQQLLASQFKCSARQISRIVNHCQWN